MNSPVNRGGIESRLTPGGSGFISAASFKYG
jgi:hypothetical protein